MDSTTSEIRRRLLEDLEEAHQTLGSAGFRARALGDRSTARAISDLRVRLSGLISGQTGWGCVPGSGMVE